MREKDVDAFLDSITFEQFREWQLFAEDEPFGDEWRQTAMMCFMQSTGKGVKVEDFMPIRREAKPAPKQTDQEIEAAFRLHFAALAAVRK